MEVPDDVVHALGEVMKMRYPSIEKILRQRAYDFEADKFHELMKRWDRWVKEETGVDLND